MELNKETIPVAETPLSGLGRPGTALPVPASITLKIARTLREVEEIREIWTQWKTHRDSDMDFCLNYVWTDPNFLRPHVVVIYRNGVPEALMVGRLERATLSERIGYLKAFRAEVRQITIAYCGLLGNDSEENSEIFVQSLLDSLGKGEADVVMFHQIAISSPIYKVASEKPAPAYRDRLAQSFPHRFMNLAPTIDQVLGAVSGGLRAEVRKKRKKFAQDFGEKSKLEFVHTLADLHRVLPFVEDVAKKTYQRGLGVGFDNSEYMQRNLEFCATNGWLRIFLLSINDQPAAFWSGTVYEGVFCSDFNGYDPQYRDYSIGTYLLSMVLEQLCSEGVKKIDFGMGEATYKERFGNHSVTESSVYIFAPRLKGMVLNTMRTATGSLDSAIKRTLGKTELLAKIKRTWRSRAAKQSAGE